MPNNHVPNVPSTERWYYDACTLDHSKSAYAEMFDKHHPIQVVISHLAFGEAYANSHLKGEDEIDAFITLMRALRPYIQVVENDNCERILERVRDKFSRLSITDALHMATAIQSGCVVIRTTDRDLLGLTAADLNGLGREFNLPHFSITRMTFRN